ncbi:MAG: sodium:proton antiporter [Gemmatimonadetes bacterium]|nr:sodium:proton antiporter [Gemmatimonadota bacterium]
MTQGQTHNRQAIPGIKDMLAVSSGKGGVGKSTLSANLAVALAEKGLRIGLLDADIYGPNIPGMLGVHERPQADPQSGRIQPIEAHGIKFLSMGLLIETGVPVIWRGPMLAKMINQFLFSTDWGELDMVLLDLPPGTGDVQITLTQSAPLTGALIVTTPSAIALEDVRRGVEMFRQTEVPLLGLVENMSTFSCDQCGHQTSFFGEGGGWQTAGLLSIPFLRSIPLDTALRESADRGQPAVRSQPQANSSQEIIALGQQVAAHFD